MTKYCSQCGNSISPNVKFCSECGAKIDFQDILISENHGLKTTSNTAAETDTNGSDESPNVINFELNPKIEKPAFAKNSHFSSSLSGIRTYQESKKINFYRFIPSFIVGFFVVSLVAYSAAFIWHLYYELIGFRPVAAGRFWLLFPIIFLFPFVCLLIIYLLIVYSGKSRWKHFNLLIFIFLSIIYWYFSNSYVEEYRAHQYLDTNASFPNFSVFPRLSIVGVLKMESLSGTSSIILHSIELILLMLPSYLASHVIKQYYCERCKMSFGSRSFYITTTLNLEDFVKEIVQNRDEFLSRRTLSKAEALLVYKNDEGKKILSLEKHECKKCGDILIDIKQCKISKKSDGTFDLDEKDTPYNGVYLDASLD